MADPSYTSGDFHDAVRRHLVEAVTATLADTKLDWAQVEPFLEAARAICRADLEAGGAELHATRREGDSSLPAEEAWIVLAARDRDSGEEWLSRSWWLSDLALAGGDRERVRAIAAGLERTVERLNDWLAAREAGEDQSG